MKKLNGNYVCFYLKKSVWVGEYPDFDNIEYDVYEEFNRIMEEVIYMFYNEKLEIAICKDGLIMVKYQDLEVARKNLEFSMLPNLKRTVDDLISFYTKYVKIINVFQNALASSIKEEEEWFSFYPVNVFVRDVIPCSFKDGKFQNASYGDNIISQYIYGGRYASSYSVNSYERFKQALHFDPRINHRMGVIKEAVARRAFDLTNVIISQDILFNIVDGLCGAISENASMNYNQSLVQSWFIIENFINIKWEQYYLDKSKFELSKNRKEFLKGRDFTASIMSNILELNNIIESDIFEKLDKIRKRRNDIAHNLKDKSGRLISAGREDCKMAFEVVNYFLKTEFSISLNTDYGVSVMGV